jgi:hypothetical protein
MLHGSKTRRPGVQARHSVISLAALPICTTMQCGEQLDVSVGLTAQRHGGGERLEGLGGDGDPDHGDAALNKPNCPRIGRNGLRLGSGFG